MEVEIVGYLGVHSGPSSLCPRRVANVSPDPDPAQRAAGRARARPPPLARRAAALLRSPRPLGVSCANRAARPRKPATVWRWPALPRRGRGSPPGRFRKPAFPATRIRRLPGRPPGVGAALPAARGGRPAGAGAPAPPVPGGWPQPLRCVAGLLVSSSRGGARPQPHPRRRRAASPQRGRRPASRRWWPSPAGHAPGSRVAAWRPARSGGRAPRRPLSDSTRVGRGWRAAGGWPSRPWSALRGGQPIPTPAHRRRPRGRSTPPRPLVALHPRRPLPPRRRPPPAAAAARLAPAVPLPHAPGQPV